MPKPVFEASVSLPAKLADVQREQPPKAETPSAELEKLAVAEKVRQDKKEREAIEQVLLNLTEAATSLRAREHEHLEEMQRLAVELAVAIASRLLHEQIQSGDYPIETLVHKVVERLDTSQPVTVFLHPADLALLQQRLGEGRTTSPEGAAAQLAGDATLARGNVRAQAGDISVSADLEEQLKDIRRSLRETLPVAGQEPDKDGPHLRPFEEKRQSA
jgi:flagellar assembly protein FliH